MKTTKMFPFITKTWNPLGGECLHGCAWCWAKALIKQYNFASYQGAPKLLENKLQETFAPEDFVFVGSMVDLFGEWVPPRMIQLIIDRVAFIGRAQFLFLSKNPQRFLEFDWKPHMIAGITLETNRDNLVFNAPTRTDRIEAFSRFQGRKFVSIEPILDFDLGGLVHAIEKIKPEFVAVGYDNYRHGLPEPSLAKTEVLIRLLEHSNAIKGIPQIEGESVKTVKVFRKTLREKGGL